MWCVDGYYHESWLIIDYADTKREAIRKRREFTRAYNKPHRIRKLR